MSRALDDNGWTADKPPVRKWMDWAVCRDLDPADWVEVGMIWGASPGNLRAIDICEHQCPVRDLCLSYVIANETTATRWGTWGGTTPAQRERIHRRNRRRK